MTSSLREVRLRAEFAAEYPAITPGVWMPAAELARKLIERAYAGRREGRHTRTFDPTHFEFRGGDSTRRAPTRRTRSTDLRPPALDRTAYGARDSSSVSLPELES